MEKVRRQSVLVAVAALGMVLQSWPSDTEQPSKEALVDLQVNPCFASIQVVDGFLTEADRSSMLAQLARQEAEERSAGRARMDLKGDPALVEQLRAVMGNPEVPGAGMRPWLAAEAAAPTIPATVDGGDVEWHRDTPLDKN